VLEVDEQPAASRRAAASWGRSLTRRAPACLSAPMRTLRSGTWRARPGHRVARRPALANGDEWCPLEDETYQ